MNELPYVYAAILDVLGYRDRLERDRKKGTLEFKDLLHQSLQCLGNINSAQFMHQAISDTIIIVCPDRSHLVQFLGVVKDVQISFLKNGLFIRGGIAFQRHFQSGAITYSAAYAAAYELENRVAVYPRIVVDHNIVEMFESTGEADALSESSLLCEWNGIHFLNVADKQNWTQLRTFAEKIYESDRKSLLGVENTFSKHWWFQEYLMMSDAAPQQASRYIPAIRTWRSSSGKE